MVRNAFPYIVAGALGMVTLLGGTAGAADDAAPAPCNDVAVTDASGDQLLFPSVAGGFSGGAANMASKGPDNTDIRRVWFNRTDGVVTANVEITNLTKDYPAEARPNDGVQWAVWFEVGDLTRYVKAVSDGEAVTYKYGGYTIEETFVLGEMGDTTGTFIEGADGVISIIVPADLGVTAGTVLGDVSGRVAFKRKDADSSYTADRAPNASADDPDVTIEDCPAPVVTEVDTTPVTTTGAATPAAPATPATPATPARPARTVKKTKKKPTKRACRKAARKFKGKKRAKALRRCAKMRH